MQLIICEKPKVAEKIAYALGRGTAVRKSAQGVPYFEVERDGNRLVVVSAVGHLYSLKERVRTGAYPVFDIEWAPSYVVDKGADYSKKYLDAIIGLSPDADECICACDFDVEGSLIGYNVIRFACGREVGSRMKFSALTNEDLENAYVERTGLDLGNAYAGEARHMLDWFYGINLSRALMSSMRQAGANQVMSTGRVQGPSLAILAKKEKEISQFVPKPYWELSCSIKKTRFDNARGRMWKKEDAQTALKDSSNEGVVEKIERREYDQPPQPPFDLTSLQVEAYRAFGFSPALTLELAQTLYEASLISYPRTSSQKLPAKLNLRKIIEALSSRSDVGGHARKILSENRLTPLEGKKDDPAHPAIHPTGLMGGIQNDKAAKLYDLIVKRFLACFCASARREAQKVRVKSGLETYAADGNRTVFQGWFEVYSPYVKLEETTLPPFSEGERVAVEDFKIDEKKTQPPKRYTPASIISELEKLGLGTKATRAAIVETLFKRGYLEGKSITVTSLGMAVFDTLSRAAPEILDEELTRKIEGEMEEIQEGDGNEQINGRDKAISDGKLVLEAILKKFDGHEREIGLGLLAGLKKKEHAASLLGKCPKCGESLRIIQSRLGKQFVGCTGYPNCNAIYPLPQNAKIIQTGAVCGKCQTPIIRAARKGKRAFEMCLDPNCETKKGWAKPSNDANKPGAISALVANAPEKKQPAKKAPIRKEGAAKAKRQAKGGT